MDDTPSPPVTGSCVCVLVCVYADVCVCVYAGVCSSTAGKPGKDCMWKAKQGDSWWNGMQV